MEWKDRTGKAQKRKEKTEKKRKIHIKEKKGKEKN